MIDYSFGVSLNYPDRMCVRVETGEYIGTVFSIQSLSLGEINLTCKFDVEMHMRNGKICNVEKFDMEKFKSSVVQFVVSAFVEDTHMKLKQETGKPKADAL